MQARPICCNRKSPCKFGCRNWIISGDIVQTNCHYFIQLNDKQGWTSEAARKLDQDQVAFIIKKIGILTSETVKMKRMCGTHEDFFNTVHSHLHTIPPLWGYEPTHTVFYEKSMRLDLHQERLIINGTHHLPLKEALAHILTRILWEDMYDFSGCASWPAQISTPVSKFYLSYLQESSIYGIQESK